MLTYLFEIWLLENHLMVSVHHLMLEVVPSPPYCNVDCPKSCLSSATNMEIMSNSLHIGGPPSPSIDGSGRRWKGTQSSGRLPPDCIDPNRASLRMLFIYTYQFIVQMIYMYSSFQSSHLLCTWCCLNYAILSDWDPELESHIEGNLATEVSMIVLDTLTVVEQVLFE